MMNADSYIKSRLGRKIDFDGYYKYQCWDLFADFEKEAGYKITNCTQTGYVADIWNYRKSNGVLKNFKEVSKSNLQKGDWIIWTKSPYGAASHVAMFVEYDGNKVKVFGQNQKSISMEACIKSLPLTGIGGCLRPTCYVKKENVYDIPNGFTKENGTCKVIIPELRVREQPNTNCKIMATYKKGQTFNYDCYKRKSDYVWVSYVSFSGKRRYVAVKLSKTNEPYCDIY